MFLLAGKDQIFEINTKAKWNEKYWMLPSLSLSLSLPGLFFAFFLLTLIQPHNHLNTNNNNNKQGVNTCWMNEWMIITVLSMDAMDEWIHWLDTIHVLFYTFIDYWLTWPFIVPFPASSSTSSDHCSDIFFMDSWSLLSLSFIE